MFVSPDYGPANMVEGSFRPGTSLTVDRGPAGPDAQQHPDTAGNYTAWRPIANGLFPGDVRDDVVLRPAGVLLLGEQ